MFSSKNIPALIYGSVINEIMEYNNILTDDSGVKSKLNFFLPPSLQPSVEPNGTRREVAQGIGHQQCFF